MKIQGINFEQYSYLSFLGMYPSYGKTTVWYALVMAKSQPDTYKIWQNHNLIYPSYGNTLTCRYPLSSMRLTDSPSWDSMIPKLEKLTESEAWSPSLVAQKSIFTWNKDLATAHFTKKYAKSEKYANSLFFSIKLVFLH